MLTFLLTLPQSSLILSFVNVNIYLHFPLDTVDLSMDSIIYLNLKSYLKHNLSFLVVGYPADTPITAKASDNVKAIWPSH